METKEVTTQNIKFNLSTEPLVSEPEIYPDYPSVQVNQITNKITSINYLPDYPWYEYIYDQFDENLPELINAGNHLLSIYINTDDCSMEFSIEQPDAQSELVEDYSSCITLYFN